MDAIIEIVRGIDVVERAADGRLRRFVVFFGELDELPSDGATTRGFG
ncbi:MAG: hypothetical protein ACRD12_16405 [Acidimicrobiales bacterium]